MRIFVGFAAKCCNVFLCKKCLRDESAIARLLFILRYNQRFFFYIKISCQCDNISTPASHTFLSKNLRRLYTNIEFHCRFCFLALDISDTSFWQSSWIVGQGEGKMLRGESYVAFHDVDVTADGVDDVETLMFNDCECCNI